MRKVSKAIQVCEEFASDSWQNNVRKVIDTANKKFAKATQKTDYNKISSDTQDQLYEIYKNIDNDIENYIENKYCPNGIPTDEYRNWLKNTRWFYTENIDELIEKLDNLNIKNAEEQEFKNSLLTFANLFKEYKKSEITVFTSIINEINDDIEKFAVDSYVVHIEMSESQCRNIIEKVTEHMKEIRNRAYNIMTSSYRYLSQPIFDYVHMVEEKIKSFKVDLIKIQKINKTFNISIQEFTEKCPELVNYVENWVEKVLQSWKKEADEYEEIFNQYVNKQISKEEYKNFLKHSSIFPFLIRNTYDNRFDKEQLLLEIPREINFMKKGIYGNFYNSVYKYIGKLEYSSNMRVTAGNDNSLTLNGIVGGERGIAKVKTILAKGPIQQPHLRTLVHMM